MTSSSHFKLISAATALALIPPDHLQPELNSLRKIHDKAFRKWEPHINLLYPFVEPSQLSAAVSVLRQHIHDSQKEIVKVELNRVDVFRHRRNAAVFLRPSVESEEMICQLRASLAACLGCSESEGTYDGTFRPHMTIGQAGLTGPGIERLTEKVEKLTGVNWASKSLVALKREPSGEMKVVEELPFGLEDEDALADTPIRTYDGYKNCFSFTPELEWRQMSENMLDVKERRTTQIKMSVASYNLMAEPRAPPFSSRLPLIIEAISSAIEPLQSFTQVLCLQEVNEEMLPLLLADPFIQKTYPFSSHSPSSLLLSHRNLVSLSSAPFRSLVLEFEERHKSMLAISFVDVEVVNVHLSSALSNQSVEAKMRQMKKITEFTQDKAMYRRDVIVAGDFNLVTSTTTIETALSREVITPLTARLVTNVIDIDIWEDAFEACNLTDNIHGVGDHDGATFDRSSNPLAAMSEPPIDRNPQRYDRILYQKGGNVHVEHFERFGLPNERGQCASDHYGVCATLRIGKAEREPAPAGFRFRVKGSSQVQVFDDSYDLLPLIAPCLPYEEDRSKREKAVQILQQTLSNDRGIQDLVLAPLGSYLMDTYFADSDVDVLAIASVTPHVFFQSASTQLRNLAARESDVTEFKGVHFVNSLVSIIELTLMGIKFDVQYCQAPELLQRYHSTKPPPDLAKLVFDPSLISKMPPSSLRPLNTYRDTAYLLNTSPGISSYRISHRFLSLYLKRRGLYSAKFGYLGGIHLSLMLNRVIKLIASASDTTDSINPSCSPATIIRTFFTYYAALDWATEVVTDPELEVKPTRSAREAVFIHAIHVPTARPNVASSCTRLSAQTFASEFGLAAKMLDQGDWAWCLRSRDEAASEFLDTFGAFVRISLYVWDIDEIGGDKVQEVVGALESKMTRLLVGLGRLLHINARIWPVRFRIEGKNERDVDEGDNQLKGYYLVGISAKKDDAERKKLLTGKIIATVRDFETSVKDSKEFQHKNVLLSLDLVPKNKISEMNLVIDERDWGAVPTNTYQPMPQRNPDNDSDSDFEGLNSILSIHLQPPPQIILELPPTSPKHRLRVKWDRNLQISEYLIGTKAASSASKKSSWGNRRVSKPTRSSSPCIALCGCGRRVLTRAKEVVE